MILMRLVWMQLRTYPVTTQPRAVISFELLKRTTGAVCEYGRPRLLIADILPSPDAAETKGLQQNVDMVLGWLASPAYMAFGFFACQGEVLEDRSATKMNQVLLGTTVLAAVLMARFLTSNWAVSLIVAAMLLSRGHLLGEIGNLSPNFPIMTTVTVWLAAAAHYIRTGSTFSLSAVLLLSLLGVLFDESLVALALTPPLLLSVGLLWRKRLAAPLLQRLRGTGRRRRVLRRDPWHQEDSEVETRFGRLAASFRWLLGLDFPPVPAGPWRPGYGRGGLLKTIEVPFPLWIFWRRRWLKLGVGWLGVSLGVVLLLYGCRLLLVEEGLWANLRVALEWHNLLQARPILVTWLWQQVGLIDLHLAASFLLIGCCAFQSPAAGLPGFLESVWVALGLSVVLAVSAYHSDWIDAAVVLTSANSGAPRSLLSAIEPRQIALWLEPSVLSLGVAGIYNLMKVLDTRIAEKG